jgi:hypothetical protein
VVEQSAIGWLSRPEVASQLVVAEGVDTAALNTRTQELRDRLDDQAAAFGEGLLDREQLARNTTRIGLLASTCARL